MTQDERRDIYANFYGKCYYCGEPLSYPEMQIDHVLPKTYKWIYDKKAKLYSKDRIKQFEIRFHGKIMNLSGVDDVRNLVSSCKKCNMNKATMAISKVNLRSYNEI